MFVKRKKIELIIEVVKTAKIIRIIDRLGISGYSVIHGVEGRGAHGVRDSQEVSDVLSNDYFVIICTNEEAEAFVAEVASVVKKFGGICFLSDVLLLEQD